MPYEPQPAPTVIALFRRTARLMVDEVVERFASVGYADMQPPFHPVFECIDPEGTRLTELAARAGITHQSMGELVAALEQRGYVERVPDPTDRRARLVRLTHEGRKAARIGLDQIRAIEAAWEERWRAAGADGEVRRILEEALAQAERDRA
jgi:DNA-binding MarR family transcriptional regulator